MTSREQWEGSRAVARTIARCRPKVVCTCPDSPSNHIVEELAELASVGELAQCEFVDVDSEFAALSVAIGAATSGARPYTATGSQSLLFIVEALYNAAGLGLPVVMTVADRPLAAGINTWDDHNGGLSQRDFGWIQLYAESNQHAVDLHLQAFRLAEKLSVPVMVCMDGSLLTEVATAVDVPAPEQVDRYLPKFRPRQVCGPTASGMRGALVGLEAHTEVRHLAHRTARQALSRIQPLVAEFQSEFGRSGNVPVSPYRLHGAETVVVALGSIFGAIKDTVDVLRAAGKPIGALGLTMFRPFPVAAVQAALRSARRVVVVDQGLAPGAGGVVAAEVKAATTELNLRRYEAVAGLGGQPIHCYASLRELFLAADADELALLTSLDVEAAVRATARDL